MSQNDDELFNQVRKLIMRAGIVVGAVLAVVLVAVVWIALSINSVQSKEIDHNRDRTRHEADVNRSQAKLLSDLKAITHPTPAQYRRQLREGIRRCLKEPSCRKLFPSLGSRASRAARNHRGGNGTSRPQSVNPSGGTPDRGASPDVPPQRGSFGPTDGTPGGRRPPQPGQSGGGHTSNPTPGGASTPTPSAPPNAPKSTISIVTQFPRPIPNPSVCADGIVGLNC